MPDILSTTVTIEYGLEDSSGRLLWEEDTERLSDKDNELYLRLYPKASDKVINTSGNLAKLGIDHADKDEYLLFEGTREKVLKYVDPTEVELQKIGNSFDVEGNPIQVNFSYDVVRNAIVADKICYGVVLVEYKAPYQLYLFGFAGDECTLAFMDGAYSYVGGYTKTLIVALNLAEPSTATISLTPEECGDMRFGDRSDKSSGPANIKLEIHKDFPPRITGHKVILGIEMSCKVRQVPAVDAEIDMSSGSYELEKFKSSTEERKRDDNIYQVSNYNPNSTEVVKDIITYNVGYSGKLQYQPHGDIKVTPTGPFLTKWGTTVRPSFALPGDEIIEVDWLSERTYTNPRRRVVESDEIVAVTGGNKTIDLYGSIKVQYVIQYKVFNVKFSVSDVSRPEDGWENIHMLATYEDTTEYLSIEAPSIKEI